MDTKYRADMSPGAPGMGDAYGAGQGWEMLMELAIQSPEFTYYTFFHPSLPINKDFSF